MAGAGAPLSERELDELDDVDDREELRRRFDMFLQELRVILPGCQILLAFLLTVPFSQRFDELDGLGRATYGVSLATAMVAVLALLAPTLLHRLGERTARRARLWWSIRLMVVGLVLLAVSLTAALWGIARFVFGTTTTWVIVAPVVAALAATWVALPLVVRRRRFGHGD